MDSKIEIINEPNEENPFIVIYKPKGLPSAPLSKDENSAISQTCALFPEVKNIVGRKQIEYGLLHRIDTETDGLLLIADNQIAYDFLLNAQQSGKFVKKYSALCEYEEQYAKTMQGFPKSPFVVNDHLLANPFTTTVSSSFRPYGFHRVEVRPVTKESNRAALKETNWTEYETKITLMKINDISIKATCEINKGFRHQVRCHLAWICTPVFGDKLYNPLSKENETMLFSAREIQFPHPITGENIVISLPLKYIYF